MFLDCFVTDNRLFSQTSKTEVSFDTSEIIMTVIILVPLVPNNIYSVFCFCLLVFFRVQSSYSFSLIIYNLTVSMAPHCFIPSNNGPADRKPARESTIAPKIWSRDLRESLGWKESSPARRDCQEDEAVSCRQGFPSLHPIAGSKSNVCHGCKNNWSNRAKLKKYSWSSVILCSL